MEKGNSVMTGTKDDQSGVLGATRMLPCKISSALNMAWRCRNARVDTTTDFIAQSLQQCLALRTSEAARCSPVAELSATSKVFKVNPTFELSRSSRHVRNSATCT